MTHLPLDGSGLEFVVGQPDCRLAMGQFLDNIDILLMTGAEVANRQTKAGG